MKKYLAVFISIIIVLASKKIYCQDTIFFKNKVEVGKVLSIEKSTDGHLINFKSITSDKNKLYLYGIKRIKFENGTEEVFVKKTFNKQAICSNAIGINSLKMIFGIFEFHYHRKINNYLLLRFPLSMAFPGVQHPFPLYQTAHQVHSIGVELLYYPNSSNIFFIGPSYRFGLIEQKELYVEYRYETYYSSYFNQYFTKKIELYKPTYVVTYFNSLNFLMGINPINTNFLFTSLYWGMGLNYYFKDGYLNNDYYIQKDTFQSKKKLLLSGILGVSINYKF
ncbi:MAG: hypothetical protein ACK4IK_06715 [Bacteroidia bacterium]